MFPVDSKCVACWGTEREWRGGGLVETPPVFSWPLWPSWQKNWCRCWTEVCVLTVYVFAHVQRWWKVHLLKCNFEAHYLIFPLYATRTHRAHMKSDRNTCVNNKKKWNTENKIFAPSLHGVKLMQLVFAHLIPIPLLYLLYLCVHRDRDTQVLKI